MKYIDAQRDSIEDMVHKFEIYDDLYDYYKYSNDPKIQRACYDYINQQLRELYEETT